MRKVRLDSAVWGPSIAENPENQVWQPETLHYTDTDTGHEVWRLSHTQKTASLFHNTIGTSPWSADGKRLLFYSTRNTAAYAKATANDPIWFHVKSDGSYLRPVKAAGAREQWATKASFAAFSPIQPDVNYWFGSTTHGNVGVNSSTLYKTVFSDTTEVARTSFGTLTAPGGPFRDISISHDGRKLLAATNAKTLLFPFDLTTGTALVPNGYPVTRSFDPYWGNSNATFNGYHGFNLMGNGDYYWMMGNGTAVFWKFKTLGSSPDGGSASHLSDHSFSYDWMGSEAEPINTVGANGTGPDPWCVVESSVADCMNYPSHIVFDRWGVKSFYQNTGSGKLSSYDIETHRYLVSNFGIAGQHQDWSAWSDWVSFTRGNGRDTGCSVQGFPYDAMYLNDRIYVVRYDNASTVIPIANTHTLYNNNGCYQGATYEYQSLPRPAQSPDGTKIAYHSTFLNNRGLNHDNLPDIFWTVAHYPYPPEIKSASVHEGKIRLTWDFNEGTAETPNTSNPRTYTKRGWPNQSSDRPPSPREIDQFRVWVSTDNVAWTPLGTTSYNNCRAPNECGTWTESSWNFDHSQPFSSTRYYGVTSVEHSGLESHTLSNIWKVTLDGTGTISSQMQETAYPNDPGGKSIFYAAPPINPSGFSYVHQQAPASAPGQYTLAWTEPTDKSLIRFYNIYAEDGSAPEAIQQNRIASVPKGTVRYVDWTGNTNGTTQYIIRSVDYQGNEGTP